MQTLLRQAVQHAAAGSVEAAVSCINDALEIDFDVEIVEALSALERGELEPLRALLEADAIIVDEVGDESPAPSPDDAAAARGEDDFDFFGAEVMIDFNETGSPRSSSRVALAEQKSSDSLPRVPVVPGGDFQGHGPRQTISARPEGARYLAEAPPPPSHRKRTTVAATPRVTLDGPPVEREPGDSDPGSGEIDLDSWDFGGPSSSARSSASRPSVPSASQPAASSGVDLFGGVDPLADAFDSPPSRPSVRKIEAVETPAAERPTSPVGSRPVDLPIHSRETTPSGVRPVSAAEHPTPHSGMAPVSTSPAAFAPTQPMEAVKPDPARLSQPTPVDESTVEHAELAAFAHHHTPAAVPMEAARVFRSARSQPTPPPVVAEPAPSGDITTPPGAEESVEETMSRVKRLRDRGDVASALQGVELVLAVDASHPEAYALREQLRHQLTVLRMAQLEPLDRVPNVTPAAMSGVSRRLNTRSAFLLSRVDGFSSIRDIIDMSGLPALEAIETMQQLIDEGFVRF